MARREGEIHVGGYGFDPADGEPELPEDLREHVLPPAVPPGDGLPEAAGGPPPDRWIVQLTRAPDAADRARAAAQLGLRLDERLTTSTFLETLTPDARAALEGDELVRAVVPFRPAYKLDPELEARTAAALEGARGDAREARERGEGGEAGGEAGESVPEPRPSFVVIGFPEATAAGLRAQLEALGLEVTSANEETERAVPRLVVRARDTGDAEAIARLPGVRWVESVGRVTFNNAVTQWVIQSNVADSRPIWGQGLRGEGQIIEHNDGGLDLGHCFFRDDADNTPRPAHRKVVAVRQVASAPAARNHGTRTAGNAAGEDVGADALSATPNPNNGNAPRAKLSHSHTGDLDFMGGTKTFRQYLDAGHADGARIHTNSWDDKTTSAYTQLSVDLDAFTWGNEDDLVIVGPDNGGTIRPPDTSKNALVVNATRQGPSNQGSFLSGVKMFTLDGRRKPDVMAPGELIVSADDGTPCGTEAASGTSYAAPAVAGAAALVRQYFTEGFYPSGNRNAAHAMTPSGALLKALLVNATVDASGIPGHPGVATSGEGWGRLLLDDGLFFDGDGRRLLVWDVRHADGLQAGDTWTTRFEVTNPIHVLRVTLVWTDPPSAAGDATPVVNDLDLIVRTPDGTKTFLGNHFQQGASAVGGSADTLNNVEMVLVVAPPTGRWQVTVVGTTVARGNPGQGFALVVTGGLAGGKCFVAGAVYGDEQHPDVASLRAWRDAHLAPGARGRPAMLALAAAYDRLGPPLARAVERRPALARVLRERVFAPGVRALRRRRDLGREA